MRISGKKLKNFLENKYPNRIRTIQKLIDYDVFSKELKNVNIKSIKKENKQEINWHGKWEETHSRIESENFTEEEIETINKTIKNLESKRRNENKILNKINKWLKDEFRTYEQGYKLLKDYNSCKLDQEIYNDIFAISSFNYIYHYYNKMLYERDLLAKLSYVANERANLDKLVDCDIDYFKSILDRWTFSDKAKNN